MQNEHFEQPGHCLQCVVVWIEKEQWLLKVSRKPGHMDDDEDHLDIGHTHDGHSVHSQEDPSITLFMATLLDIATGINFIIDFSSAPT